MDAELLEHKVGSSWESRIVAGAVRDIRHTSRGFSQQSLDTVTGVVCEATFGVLKGSLDDFFIVTEHSTSGTACHVSLTVLADKIRAAITTAAHELLFMHGHVLELGLGFTDRGGSFSAPTARPRVVRQRDGERD